MEEDSYKPQEYTIRRTGSGRHYSHTTKYIETYKSTFETLDDRKTSAWKRGDLIKFNSCFRWSWKYDEQWQAWFMNEDEYFDFLRRNCKLTGILPMYAHHEYAIVLNRYKWTKYKSFKTYRDYGVIIMMLSGRRAGHIRRYYMTTPWEFVAGFPYKNFTHPDIPKIIVHPDLQNIMPIIQDSLDNDLQVFLKNITEKFT